MKRSVVKSHLLHSCESSFFSQGTSGFVGVVPVIVLGAGRGGLALNKNPQPTAWRLFTPVLKPETGNLRQSCRSGALGGDVWSLTGCATVLRCAAAGLSHVPPRPPLCDISTEPRPARKVVWKGCLALSPARGCLKPIGWRGRLTLLLLGKTSNTRANSVSTYNRHRFSSQMEFIPARN